MKSEVNLHIVRENALGGNLLGGRSKRGGPDEIRGRVIGTMNIVVSQHVVDVSRWRISVG